MMERLRKAMGVVALMALPLAVVACSNGADESTERGELAAGTTDSGETGTPSGGGGEEHAEGGEGERGGEHAEGGEEHDGEGEESGEYVSEADPWDRTRNGARLQLVFDPGYQQFIGQVVNTTDRRLCAVRVEVHLEGGPELGPTAPADIEPGAAHAIELGTEGARFERFTAHTELSPCGN